MSASTASTTPSPSPRIVSQVASYDTLHGHVWRYGRRDEDAKELSSPQAELTRLHDVVQDLVTRARTNGRNWTPCDHGQATTAADVDDGTSTTYTRVLDVTIRSCVRLSIPSWTDNRWFQGPAQSLIHRAHAGVDPTSVRFRDHELLRYNVGDHFAEHVDRQRRNDHVGTLLFVVPSSDLRGGHLVHAHAEPATDDAAPQAYMAFIPLGVPHSVSAVTAGFRYVLKAAVCARRLAAGERPPKIERLCD